MKPNQLQAFVMVAEQSSIRAAARELGISQPAVTKIIRELERAVGAPLVERSVKGIKLTAFGEAFAPRAQQLLADMDRAREEIAQIRNGASGKVSVAVSTAAALTVTPPAFKEFHARLPGVDVHFSELVLPWTLSRLRNGSLDFAVAHVSPQALDPEFEDIELFPVRLTVGMRNRHPMRHCQSLSELQSAEWLMPGESAADLAALAPIFSPLGMMAPTRVIFGQSVTVALALVGQTDLVGLFVEPLADIEFKRYGIRRIEVRERLPALSMCILKRKDQRLTPAAQQLAECLARAAAPWRA